tara:strand:+ start:146 stop:733 length:588 start_codon:yes stop_codon:yes gene_type:complete
MKCKVKNNSNLDMSSALPLLKSLYSHAYTELGFDRPANISFYSDLGNAKNPLGKTAHYSPRDHTVTVYTDGRHLKDVLRSIAHELVHHDQNCNGAFDKPFQTGPGYAQQDPRMRELERDAYERGNMMFRDWEDTQKWRLTENKQYTKELPKVSKKTQEKKVIKGNEPEPKPKKVSNKEWYENNLYKSLMDKWVKK